MAVAAGMFGIMLVIAIVIVVFFLIVALFQWLWNTTMPDVFGVNAVTYWQGFRLLLLAALLFGGHAAANAG